MPFFGRPAAAFLVQSAAHTGEAVAMASFHAGISYAAALSGLFANTAGALQIRHAISDWGAGKSRERALTALVILDRLSLGTAIGNGLFAVPELLTNASRYLFEYMAWRNVLKAHLQASPEAIRAAVEQAWAAGGPDISAAVAASIEGVKAAANPLAALGQVKNNTEIVQKSTELAKKVLEILQASAGK